MTDASRLSSARGKIRPLPAVITMALLVAAVAPVGAIGVVRGVDLVPVDHLVVSEVVTGGESASDELIELHNPTGVALPLEGLEVVYVTASGATVSRRAAWELGAPSVPPGGHVLVANASGFFAPIADATYASGMAATGGSVAIRILGATTAIDAVGWGTAASSWLEGTPAAPPAVGASIERLPGGALGSGHDTNDNLADFAHRLVPEPQNLASPPTPDPTAPTPSAAPTAEPTPAPSPSTSMPIAAARAEPDGTTVTVEAVALTGADFHDGGGFVADATGGIAVLLTDGTFAPGELLRITGELDDRFSQRTLRSDAGSLLHLGPASQPAPIAATTGAVGESLEGQLVRIGGSVLGSPTTLTSGLGFDVDDGSGAIRVVVGTATGIDTTGWQSGATVDLVGVAGQRDSTGSGTEGYRVMPRGPADVIGLAPPSGSPAPTSSPGEPSPTPSAPPGSAGVTPIGDARAAPKDTQLRIRGVVTLPAGLLDDRTAVVQDATGAILLRLGEEAGRPRLGTRIEVDGKRSTLSGMESLRVTLPIVSLGTAVEPATREIRTGDVGEADEATLVVARGAIVASARRASSGTVSFEIDDGSGPLRVSIASRLGAERDALTAGTWVEVRGVLGQQTSRSKPTEGYRIWPRSASEVRVTAAAVDGAGTDGTGGGSDGSGASAGGMAGSLDEVGAADLAQLRIGATLVVGPWKELGIGGLLWDGSRLVAVHASSGRLVARLTRERRPPLALELGGLKAAGLKAVIGAPVVRLGSGAGQTVVLDAPPAPPRSTLTGALPAWVTVVGRLSGPEGRRTLRVDGPPVVVRDRCESDDGADPRTGTVTVTALAIDEPLRLLVPCGGVRPVPRIASAPARKSLTDGAGDALPAVLPAADQAVGDPRRPVVAGLLVVAAAALVGGALLARRRQPDGEGPANPSDGDVEIDSGPHLTLVRVPHESGP